VCTFPLNTNALFGLTHFEAVIPTAEGTALYIKDLKQQNGGFDLIGGQE